MQDEAFSQDIRSGAYYRRMKEWYAQVYLSPISGRSLYVILTLTALAIAYIAYEAVQSLFPLNVATPFTFSSPDALETTASLKPLAPDKLEANAAIRRFLVTDYVTRVEAYAHEALERNITVTRNRSSQLVYNAYIARLNTANPKSPVVLYQRNARRDIDITAIRQTQDPTNPNRFTAEVDFTARVTMLFETRQPSRPSLWTAKLAADYDAINIDGMTGETTPLRFVVTDYNVQERIQGAP